MRQKWCVFCGKNNRYHALSCQKCRRPFPAYNALVTCALATVLLALVAAIFFVSD